MEVTKTGKARQHGVTGSNWRGHCPCGYSSRDVILESTLALQKTAQAPIISPGMRYAHAPLTGVRFPTYTETFC